MKLPFPLSPQYDRAIYEAIALQMVLGSLSLMFLDGGELPQICGVAMISFWGGAILLIARRPLSPSKIDLKLIRFGYLPVLVIAFFLVGLIWRLRGVS